MTSTKIGPATTLQPPRHQATSGRPRRGLLVVDGAFLAIVGGIQVILELLSYYWGAGPHGAIFDQSDYTIGWVENHGLALLIGLLFLTVAAQDGRRFWHGFGLAVHLLLATANLTFWSSFVYFDLVPMGIAATSAHVGFIAAHALWLTRNPRGQSAVTS